eukprot:297709-Amphidinium_carterae.2
MNHTTHRNPDSVARTKSEPLLLTRHCLACEVMQAQYPNIQPTCKRMDTIPQRCKSKQHALQEAFSLPTLTFCSGRHINKCPSKAKLGCCKVPPTRGKSKLARHPRTTTRPAAVNKDAATSIQTVSASQNLPFQPSCACIHPEIANHIAVPQYMTRATTLEVVNRAALRDCPCMPVQAKPCALTLNR